MKTEKSSFISCFVPCTMADGKNQSKSRKLPAVIVFAYEDFKTDEVKLLQWAKCKKCKASDLASSGNGVASPHPVDDVHQQQQVAVPLARFPLDQRK